MALPRFQIDDSALLVVDVQEKLVPVMHESNRLIKQASRLIDGANALGLPVLVTEQYRKGLGVTVPELVERLTPLAVCNHEKLKFSACIQPVRDELSRLNRRNVIVCGIEGHVCVLQSCLDLMGSGFVTAIVTDAVSSRRENDCRVAIDRMVQAGVVPTTVESILLELVHEAGTDRFKSILPIIK